MAEFSLRGKTAQYLQSKNGFFEQLLRTAIEQQTVLGSQFNVSKPTEKHILYNLFLKFLLFYNSKRQIAKKRRKISENPMHWVIYHQSVRKSTFRMAAVTA